MGPTVARLVGGRLAERLAAVDGRALHRGGAVAVALLAPPFVIFVHPTLELVRRNGEYFTVGYVAGWQLYLAAFELLLAGVVLWHLRDSPAFRVVLGVYLLSGVGWFAYTMAARAVEPRWSLLALLAVILVIGGIRLRNRLEDAVQTLGLVGAILVVGLGSSSLFAGGTLESAAVASDQQRAGDVAATPEGEPRDRSRLPNVYHLVLDEFQTEMFASVLTKEAERDLDGFLWFPEASTPFGRTEMALASEFAARSYGYGEPLSDYITRAYTAEGSLLGILEDAGYATTGWVPSLRVFGGSSPFDVTHLHRDVAGDAVAHDEQAELVRSTWVYTRLPRTLSKHLIPPYQFAPLEGDVLLPDDAPPVSAMSFRAFLDSEGHDAPARGRYVLTHLILPHFPHVLDANCAYLEGTRTNARKQSRCALRLMGEFVDRLQSLDRYDGSMIIIQSDHGAGFDLRNGKLERVPMEFYSERWSRSRSRPLLLIKPPGSTHEGIRVSPLPATLEDVAPTVVDALGLAWVPPQGRVSLLADRFPERARRYYHFYDKDPDDFIRGALKRFVITTDGIAFDRSIPVPDG
ncbi:MAG: hypothetical protein ACRDUY_10160 [Nitriliruptorales bacterium]